MAERSWARGIGRLRPVGEHPGFARRRSRSAGASPTRPGRRGGLVCRRWGVDPAATGRHLRSPDSRRGDPPGSIIPAWRQVELANPFPARPCTPSTATTSRSPAPTSSSPPCSKPAIRSSGEQVSETPACSAHCAGAPVPGRCTRPPLGPRHIRRRQSRSSGSDPGRPGESPRPRAAPAPTRHRQTVHRRRGEPPNTLECSWSQHEPTAARRLPRPRTGFARSAGTTATRTGRVGRAATFLCYDGVRGGTRRSSRALTDAVTSSIDPVASIRTRMSRPR